MKKHISKTKLALCAGAATLAALVPQVQAQSSDALIDKLVDKGILTVDEAKDLRVEADKDFKAALQAKSGMPDWVTSYKISGDFRGRFEDIAIKDTPVPDRERFRYRLRAGLTVNMLDDLEAGFRLTSDEPARNNSTGGDPISGNTTMTGNGSKKFIYIDQAYGKWSPLHDNGWTGGVIAGKMENPFTLSDLVFDPDYTPEGAALQLGYEVNDQHTVRFNGGGFSLLEIANSGGDGSDVYLFGGQVRLDSKWNSKLSSSAGFAYLDIPNASKLTTASEPDQNAGNWRTGGVLDNKMRVMVADAAVTYLLDSFPLYNGAFPIKLAGEFLQNPSANTQDTGWSAGFTFGKAGKKGLWEVSYRYKHLEANAWYEELVDSDTGAYYGAAYHGSPTAAGYFSGTNIKGHVFKGVYNFTDSFSFNVTYLLTTLVERPNDMDSQTGRLQVDANWKF